MEVICPKCNYERKESDTNPEWQCPSCEVAYNKVNTQQLAPKKNSKKGLYLLLGIGLLVVAVGSKVYLDERFEQAKAEQVKSIKAVAKKWSNLNQIASSTPRIALSEPVLQLQSIYDELMLLPADGSCVSASKDLLADYMSLTILGYLRFMRKEPGVANLLIEDAQSSLNKYKSTVETCPN